MYIVWCWTFVVWRNNVLLGTFFNTLRSLLIISLLCFLGLDTNCCSNIALPAFLHCQLVCASLTTTTLSSSNSCWLDGNNFQENQASTLHGIEVVSLCPKLELPCSNGFSTCLHAWVRCGGCCINVLMWSMILDFWFYLLEIDNYSSNEKTLWRILRSLIHVGKVIGHHIY
jgi:hypothetical protein